MNTIAFDTFAINKRLKSKGFTESQADAITEEIQLCHDSMQETFSDGLVTKADLLITKSELKGEILNTKIDLIKWMIGLLFAQTALILTVVKFLG